MKNKPKHTGPTLIDRLPKNKGEHLELMIHFTQRAITNTETDLSFVAQLERLKKELADWHQANL